MADYLTVNRFNIPVMDSQARFDPRGRLARGVSGHLGGSFTSFKRTALKREWKLKTPLLDSEEVESAQGLLLGDGHAWDFESATLFTTSSRGLEDDGQTGVTRTTSFKKYGAASIDFVNGSANISWLTGLRAVGVPERWTVAFWFGGATFVHHVENSIGVQYVSGVVSSFSAPSIAVSTTGRLTITATSSPARLDDLIVVPYIMSASLIASIAADNFPFSPLPELAIGGTIDDAHNITTGLVRPETFSRQVRRFGGSSGFTTGGTLEFDLVEA